MEAVHLKTEYLAEPLGLGTAQPRFYWNCSGGTRQTAYQIVCTRKGKSVWDSGKVVSSSMTHIAYGGKPLQSRDRVCWRVRLWDENDRPGDWNESWFELGLLHPEDWQAKWITGDHKPRKNTRYPADCFRKTFATGNSIAQARLYITACGLYEAVLNGQRVGNFQLAPGSTDYRKRIQYQTHDVTALLREKNTLDVTLCDGWYRGSIGAFGFTNVYGRQTKLLCQLELTCADGKRETILSDESWQWSNDGPVRFADLKDGEVIDAAMRPGFSGHARPAKETVVPTASDNVFPTMHERFSAKRLTTPSGKNVLDFGQNLAGFLSFRAKGARGKKIRLLLGETLDSGGEFTQVNFQLQRPVKEPGQLASILLITGNAGKLRGEKQPTPMQEIVFRCSGGEDCYRTRFAVFGFRYALLEMDAGVEASEFEAIAVYSDLAQTGEFTCSNEKVNRLVSAAQWSMKSNFLDVPTDCPTRERLAWTGDAQIFFDTGSYFMDTAPFFSKWLRDLRDAQKKNGQLPAVAPYSGAFMLYDNTGTAAGWLDCGVLLPYRFWKRYGDFQMLREAYPLLRDTAEFMLKHTGHKDKKAAKADPNNDFVYEHGVQLGEWLEPEDFRDEVKAGRTEPHTEEATAYFCYSMACAAEVAHALGEITDEARFHSAAEGAKRAYQALFLRSCPDTDRQAKLVRPLALELADEEMAKTLAVRLAKAVQNREYRIGTGFLSTPFVLDVLTKCGRSDLAYRMLENEACPGWLYEIDHGATTLWEEWEGGVDDSNSGSRNHYSPGAVCGWLFDTCAGIRADGENRFVIAPTPGGTLRFAEGSYQSLYGKVTSRWERKNEKIIFTITIPANCTAEICLPDGSCRTAGTGRHEYEI